MKEINAAASALYKGAKLFHLKVVIVLVLVSCLQCLVSCLRVLNETCSKIKRDVLIRGARGLKYVFRMLTTVSQFLPKLLLTWAPK
jgi:hypothetical protein